MSLKSSSILNEILGDLEEDTITTFFGPPGAGKSTICFQYCVECVRSGKKVIFVDTEGGFSPQRVLQMEANIDLSQIIVLTPTSFEEQQKTILNLNQQIKNNSTIGLIVIDSLAMLYRLKQADSTQKINKELAEQLRLLTELSRHFHIPIIVINQMYTHFDTNEKKMLGGSIIEYWSKIVVLVDKDGDDRKLLLKKHKYKKEGVERFFDIDDRGVISTRPF